MTMAQENSDIDVEMGITLKKLTQQLALAEARMNKTAKRSEDQFKKMADNSVNGVARIDRQAKVTDTTFGRLTKTAKGLLPALAVGAVVAGLVKIGTAARTAVSDIARIGDQASLAGLDTSAFQELDYLASQSRIPMDTLADGIKELQLRADEFAVTGKGPAAEAFERIGYSAEDAARALEDPSDMFLTLIGRMEELDQAGQIRVADELFGGSAGERFVQLVGRGEQELRDMVSTAHDLGVVLEEDAIVKAQELDAKFAAVTAQMRTLWQTGVVGAAEFFDLVNESDAETLEGVIARLENLGAVGISPDANTDDLEQLQNGLLDLEVIYQNLLGEVGLFEQELIAVGQQLASVGQIGAAQRFFDLAEEVRASTSAFEANEISAVELEKDLEFLMGQAAGTAGSLGQISDVSFDGLISRLGGLSLTLQAVAGWAATAAANVLSIPLASKPTYTEDEHFFDQPGADNLVNPPTTSAPTSSVRPQTAPNNIDFGLAPLQASSGGGGGGGRSSGRGGRASRDEMAELLEQGEEELRQMQQRIDLIGKSEAEQARLEFTFKALEDAKRANLELDGEIAGTSLTLREKIEAQADEVYRLAQAYEFSENRQRAFEAGLSSMSDELASVIVQGKNLGDVLSNAFLQAGQSYLASGLQNLGQMTGGGGGTGAAIFQGIAGIFGGGRANGGHVDPSRVYEVGERGRELFVPDTAGTIVPGSQLSPVTSMAPLQVEIYVKDDGRIGAIARQQGGAAAQQAVVSIREEIPGIMQDYEKRAG